MAEQREWKNGKPGKQEGQKLKSLLNRKRYPISGSLKQAQKRTRRLCRSGASGVCVITPRSHSSRFLFLGWLDGIFRRCTALAAAPSSCPPGCRSGNRRESV